MRALLRGKMLAALRALRRLDVFSGFHDFRDPEAFDRLMARLHQLLITCIAHHLYCLSSIDRAGAGIVQQGRVGHATIR